MVDLWSEQLFSVHQYPRRCGMLVRVIEPQNDVSNIDSVSLEISWCHVYDINYIGAGAQTKHAGKKWVTEQ